MRDMPLNKDTFSEYCSKNYDGGYIAGFSELDADLNRIKYIKKLITRHERNNDLKERLILNHIMVINNVFGSHAAARILYYKLHEDFHIIKPFLVLINIMPEWFYDINDKPFVETATIPMDQKVVNALRKL